MWYKSYKSFFIFCLLINSLNIHGQSPANDDCVKAINVQINTTQLCSNIISGSTLNATSSTVIGQPSCNPNSIDDDVWYKFIATSNKHVIEIIGSSPLYYPSFEVYSGNCGNLTSLGLCVNGSTSVTTEIATGLTIGETYFIRVYSNFSNAGFNGAFTICISSILNDDCVGAENLSIGALCTATFGNTKLATQSSISGQVLCSSHNGWNDDDLWFKFTTPAIPSSSYNISVDGGSFGAGIGLVSPNFSVYSGVCGALNLLSSACTTPTSGVCVYTQNSNIANLSANTTYYIRVYSWVNASSYRGKFNICVTNGTGLPAFTSSPTALDFGSLCLGDSLVKSFVLNGVNLNGGNISINALQGLSYSTDNINFTPTLGITSCGGSLTQNIYVKFLPTNTQTYNGNISISGGGGNTNISVIAAASSGLSAENPLISASNNPVCVGNNLTLSILSGALNNSSYWQWYMDGCGVTPIDTGAIINISPIGSSIKYFVRGEGGCALPGVCDSVEIQVSGIIVPSIVINTSAVFPICQGENVDFSSNISNGGTSPTYQWKVNGIDQGVNNPVFSSSILNNGDTVSCTLISNDQCANPNSLISNSIIFSGIETLTEQLNTFLCKNEKINFNGIIIDSPGLYHDTLISSLGCDSIIVLIVSSTIIDTSLNLINSNTLEAGQSNGTYTWIDCSTYQIIANEITQSYAPTTSGSFASVIQYSGCIDTTTCVSVVITNIEEHTISKVSVFPNPFNNIINLFFSNEIKGIVEISLYSVTGKKLLFKQVEATNNEVNVDIEQLHELPNGIYFLIVKNNAYNHIYKVNKN